MAKSLVIVESPAKAKTIGKYLGNQYIVKASLGHIKDLPKKDLAVEVDADFRPDYQVIEGKKKLITELKTGGQEVSSPSTSRLTLIAKARRSAPICRKSSMDEDRQEGRSADLPRDVQRDHEERDSEGFREAADGQSATWWKRSRRAVCSTGWSATRSRRCCGTRSGAGFRPDACRPSRCA